jgi:TetR/AcrR family transcriptional regulator, tetracycline repressor protein
MATADGRQRLTRQRIVEAALAIVDRDGLEGLTMRALGRELGADPMAVYHHVPSKEALFDGLVDAVWAEMEVPALSGPWQRDLADLARSVRRALRSHPNALPVVSTRQNLGASGLRLLDTGIAVLTGAGFDPPEALELMSAASAFVVGHALAEVGRPPGGAGDVPVTSFVAAVAAEPRPHPHLLAALADGAPDPDAVFERGLAALIGGAEQLADPSCADPADQSAPGPT